MASKVIYTRPCPPGMFYMTDSHCESCPRGTFSEEEKSQACSPCPMGTFYNGFGATSELNCTQCPKGTYNDKTGSVSIDQCTKCPKVSWGIFRRMRVISPTLQPSGFYLSEN